MATHPSSVGNRVFLATIKITGILEPGKMKKKHTLY